MRDEFEEWYNKEWRVNEWDGPTKSERMAWQAAQQALLQKLREPDELMLEYMRFANDCFGFSPDKMNSEIANQIADYLADHLSQGE